MTVSLGRPLTGLIPALLAAVALIGAPPTDPINAQPVPGQAQVWSRASRADISAQLADGTSLQPLFFLDPSTVVGTAATADGRAQRLVVRNPDGSVRQLRRLAATDDPQFGPITTDGNHLIWMETTDRRQPAIWTAPLHDGRPARRLTADTGDATLYGNQYDLITTGGRLYWTAFAGDAEHTEIRSVALTGGPVRVRDEAGSWALSAWPWLTDEADRPSGTSRLRNMSTGQEITVATNSMEDLACTPVWCRAILVNGGSVDLRHPDGSARRRIAGAGAQAAVTDVAVLDRFEFFSRPGPASDLTGTAALFVHDISIGSTVELSPGAGGVLTSNGIVGWSTGERETVVWHSVDLKTVK